MLRARLSTIFVRLIRDYRGHRCRSIARELFFRLSRRFTPQIETESDGLRFAVKTYDRAVARMTFVDGPPERDFMRSTAHLLRSLGFLAEEGVDTFLEVGANIGTATVLAMRENGFSRAECFEPLPENAELLKRNLALNGLSDRANVHQIALSDADGTVEFEISPDNSGDGRVRFGSEPGYFGEDARSVVKVDTKPLDTFIELGIVNLERIGLAWIDAQGSEGRIFAGAGRLLASSVPVVVEFWPYGIDRAGGRGLFAEAVSSHYETIMDLSDPEDPKSYDASEISALFELYSRPGFFDPAAAHASTDLLLLKEGGVGVPRPQP